MRHSIITAAMAILVSFGSIEVMACQQPKSLEQSKETSFNTDDPTPAITQFVKTYFPKANISMVHPDRDEYEVKLNDGTKIEFTRGFEWKKIDCEHSSSYTNIPAELVPEQITNYVKNNFGSQGITKIEKKRKGWDIELTSKLGIKFNKNFVVTKMDN